MTDISQVDFNRTIDSHAKIFRLNGKKEYSLIFRDLACNMASILKGERPERKIERYDAVTVDEAATLGAIQEAKSALSEGISALGECESNAAHFRIITAIRYIKSKDCINKDDPTYRLIDLYEKDVAKISGPYGEQLCAHKMARETMAIIAQSIDRDRGSFMRERKAEFNASTTQRQ